MRKKVLGLFSIIFIALVLVACGTKSFDVNFELNGGTSAAIETQKIKKDGLVDKPSNPTRDGYTFEFWAEKETEEKWEFATDKVTKKITLVAQWEIKKYNVTFDAKGGAPTPAAQVIEHGAKATEPEFPALVGNQFLGWFLAGEETPYNFDSKVTKHLVLEAKWSLDEFTVTFDLDGGEPAIEDKVIVYNGLVEEPAAPTKDGFSFLGWFVDGEEYDFDRPVKNDLTIQARWQLDYDAAITALIAHYEDTLGNPEWFAEDIELISEINSAPITWTSSNPDYFTNDGKVTKPAFSEGDQTIMLTAQLTPIKSHMFFFIVEALEQTTEELLDEILRIVTVVPVSPTGYQETNFEITKTYMIDEQEVAITWETSDDEVMTATGELVAFEDAAEKNVTLTATITYNDVTRTREITFLVKCVTTYTSFLDAFVDQNKGEKVKVEGVRYFTPIKANESNPNGYYLASQDNQIGFVYGAPSSTLKQDKLYDVIFEVDIYYGSYQLKSPSFSNERDGELPEITPIEVTLDDIVNLPKPLTKSFNHQYIKLTNVKVHVVDPNDNYQTFLVPQDLNTETTQLNDMNSLMIYYVSNMEVIQGLNGKRIDEILLINNGYRTNNVVWYVNYVGDGSDIVMGALNDEEAVVAAKEQLESSIPFKVINEDAITLPIELFGATISWTSNDEAVIDPTTGEVKFATEAVTVKLTATITAGTEELNFERDVWVGTPEQLSVSSIADVRAYDGIFGLMPFKVEGVVTGATGDRSFSIYDGDNALVIRTLYGVSLDYGFKYTIVGYKALFNGLVQLGQSVEAVKGDAAALEEPITLTEANLKDNAYLETIQAHLVSIDAAEITNIDKDSHGNYEITLKVGTAQINVRWDSRVNVTQDAKDRLAELVVGDNVKIVGAPLGWYNGPQLGYNAASQIQIAGPETDEDIVAAAIAALDIPQVTTVNLNLPTVGRFEANIVWTSSNTDVIANDGTLTMPLENTTVTLTAVVSYGTASEEVEYQVLVQAEEGVLNVKLTRALAKGDPAKFKGIVTGIVGDRYVYVSDEDGTTIPMYSPVENANLALGDKVLVEGAIDIYNELVQVGSGGTLEILETGLTLPSIIELDTIPEFSADDQGKRYNIENLIVLSVNGRTMTVTKDEKEFNVYVDPNVPELVDYLATATGKKVNLVGIRLGWFNAAQFLFQDITQVEIVDLTTEEKVQQDLNKINLPATISTEVALTLITEGPSSELAITWSSDYPEIIAADGTVVLPEEDTLVTLTATIVVGETAFSNSFEVLVKSKHAPVEHTVELKYSGPMGNLEADNQAALLNLDETIFTVLAIQGPDALNNIGVNAAGQIRIYSVRGTGEGNTLKVSIADGGIIKNVEFHFTATTGNTVQSTSGLLMLGTEEHNLNEADLTTTQTYSDLDITEFSLKNNHMGGDKNGQIWITKIVITYTGNFA